MTLIALTLNRNYPVLMGDLLISSSESDGDIETPTFVRGTGKMFADKVGKKPITLRQKLYIINERLCVALGGNVVQMEKLLKRLKAIYGESDFDYNDLKSYLRNYPPEDRTKLLAIVLRSFEVNGEVDFSFQTVGEFLIKKSDRYGLVVAGGSGDEQFVDFIASDPPFVTDITNSDGDLILNQYLISYWLGREVSRADSLLNKWGAGYEMIVFENGKFIKLEYTVLLLVGKFGKDVPFDPAPFNTILVHYQDDVMIIRAYAGLDDEKVFPVPSILDHRDSIFLKDHEPKHETLIATYLIHDVDSNIEYLPTIVRPRNVNEEGKSPFLFEFKGNVLKNVLTDSREDERILSMIKRLVKDKSEKKVGDIGTSDTQ